MGMIVILQGFSTPVNAIVAELPMDINYCDARQFRQAVGTICAFHRRDVSENIGRCSAYLIDWVKDSVDIIYVLTDYYNPIDGGGRIHQYADGHYKVDDTQPQFSFAPLPDEMETRYQQPAAFFSARVKRIRAVSLHNRCCLNGCTVVDIAGLC